MSLLSAFLKAKKRDRHIGDFNSVIEHFSHYPDTWGDSLFLNDTVKEMLMDFQGDRKVQQAFLKGMDSMIAAGNTQDTFKTANKALELKENLCKSFRLEILSKLIKLSGTGKHDYIMPCHLLLEAADRDKTDKEALKLAARLLNESAKLNMAATLSYARYINVQDLPDLNPLILRCLESPRRSAMVLRNDMFIFALNQD